MKKILLLIAIVSLLACKKDEPEKTTYQVVNNTNRFQGDDQYLNGTLWEVVVFCYAGDDIVAQDNLEPVSPDGGTSEKQEVSDNITKIKLSFKLLPPESPYYDLPANNRKYTVAFTPIDKGKNNTVIIDGNTMLSGEIKSTNSSEGFDISESISSLSYVLKNQDVKRSE